MAAVQPNELELQFRRILKEHGMSLEDAGRTVANVFRSKARRATHEQMQDALQAVWLGVLNYARTGVRIESLESLLVVMAKRQAYRTYAKEGRQMVSIDNQDEAVQLSQDESGRNEARRRMFMIREFLRNASPGCLEVLDLLHEGYDLKEIADQLSRGHAALRKGWSRCMELIRDAFAADGNASGEWTRLFS
jgi:RNA polymerase sigma factor (sigma-70 family)